MDGSRRLGPVVLEGRHIRLEPLRPRHRAGLVAAAGAPGIWTWLSADLRVPEAMDAFLADALRAEELGTEFPFAVVRQEDGRVLGSTRYLDVTPAHRRLEIGWTWYEPAAWGTATNPEAKFLLLRHAFEAWGAVRVALHADGENRHSQAAIRKLGAVHEGVLRRHKRRPDGTWRDTVVFSILDAEWPERREALRQRLAAPCPPG